MDDEALARLAQAGDREAFAELVDRHAPSVGRMLSAMVDRPEQVADLVQETFCNAWTALPRYRARCFGGWVRQIALNCGRQTLRSAWWRRVQLTDQPVESAANGHSTSGAPGAAPPTPCEALLNGERAARIRGAIARLPRAQAEAVRLRFLLGETYTNAAELLGVPEGTVRSRVHAGVARLRGELAEYFEEFER